MKFALEDTLITMANSLLGAYIFAVFDCCKHEMPNLMLNTAEENIAEKDAQAREKKQSQTGNLFMLFACEQDKAESAWTSVSKQIFMQFQTKADVQSGEFWLPQSLDTFKVGNYSHTTDKTVQKIRLKHSDWQVQVEAPREKFNIIY